jgi:hypothetical protein
MRSATSVPNYDDPNLVNNVERCHLATKAEVIVLAKDLASLDRPMEGEPLDRYVAGALATYEALEAEVDQRTQYAASAALATIAITLGKELTAKLKERIGHTAHEMKLHANQLRELVPPTYLKARLVLCILLSAIAAGFEAVMSKTSFQGWGLSSKDAMIAGVLFALGIGTVPHALTALVRDRKWNKTSIMLFASALVALAATYFYIGQGRNAYLMGARKSAHLLQLSPMAFMIVSLVVVGALTAVCILVMPRRAEWNAAAKYGEVKKDHDATKAKLAGLEKELDEVPTTVAQQISELALKQAFAIGLKKRVAHYADETVSAFVVTNAAWRRSPVPQMWEQRQRTVRTISFATGNGAVVIFAALSMLLSGCSDDDHGRGVNIALAVLADRSNEHLTDVLERDIPVFKQLLRLDDDFHSARTVWIEPVTDRVFNEVQELRIDGFNPDEENEINRIAAVEQFGHDLDAALHSQANTYGSLEASIIHRPLVAALRVLREDTTSGKRILVLYSDCLENTVDVSFYNDSVIAVLRNDPQRMVRHFLTQADPGDLTGITIVIIPTAVNYVNSERIDVATRFFASLLSDRGATVIIRGNLPPTLS